MAKADPVKLTSSILEAIELSSKDNKALNPVYSAILDGNYDVAQSRLERLGDEAFSSLKKGIPVWKGRTARAKISSVQTELGRILETSAAVDSEDIKRIGESFEMPKSKDGDTNEIFYKLMGFFKAIQKTQDKPSECTKHTIVFLETLQKLLRRIGLTKGRSNKSLSELLKHYKDLDKIDKSDDYWLTAKASGMGLGAGVLFGTMSLWMVLDSLKGSGGYQFEQVATHTMFLSLVFIAIASMGFFELRENHISPSVITKARKGR